MDALLKFLEPVVVQVAVTAFVMLPLAYWLWRMHQERRKQLERSEEPFNEFPNRPPGESLRLRIAAMEETRNDRLYELLLLPLGLGLMVGFAPQMRNPIGLGIVFLIVAGFTFWRGRALVELSSQIRDCKLGYLGERVVGEKLNQLMLDGFRVFHDVPFDGFNIDHVILGQQGIFAVETKARRKPRDGHGTTQYHVAHNGDMLKWPKARDDSSVAQIRRNARTLASFLSSATGERVDVYGVLVVPGWWIDRAENAPLEVINEKEFGKLFADVQRLSSEQMTRIAHQLTEKCRIEGEKREAEWAVTRKRRSFSRYGRGGNPVGGSEKRAVSHKTS